MTSRDGAGSQRARSFVGLWRTSARARLAITYAATLAIALSLFAGATSIYLSRSSTNRVDASLVESVQLVRRSLENEADENATLDVAAVDAVRDVRFRDRRILIYGADGQLLAVSDSAPLSGAVPLSALTDIRASAVSLLTRALSRNAASAPVTIGTDDESVRGLAAATSYRVAPITIVALRGLASEEEASETFVGWLLAAIPVALMFAGVGGYLLARASLAPALALAQQAEQIGASHLDARLSVANADDELGRLAGVLNGVFARLEESFVQQRRFMSDASHELRTPIAVVRSAADVALTTADASVESLRDSLSLVRAEAVRMTRIVNDLFLLSRADSVAHPVRRERLFLEELVAEAARAGRTLGRDVGVNVTASAELEAPFVGDGNLIGRLLLNLVDNAVHYSPATGVVQIILTLCSRPELPDMQQLHGAWYRITVDDDGPGVEPALHATLFDRFVRGGSGGGGGGRPETRLNPGGAGLGLAIARWVTDVHAGHVFCDFTRTNGARFVVLLPVSHADVSSADGVTQSTPSHDPAHADVSQVLQNG
jgi:signal transduction histidine kinase